MKNDVFFEIMGKYALFFNCNIHTLNLCDYFIYFIAVNMLGGRIFFLFAEIGPTICCRLPDEASFLEIGGVYHPSIPPGSFGPVDYYIVLYVLLHDGLSSRS